MAGPINGPISGDDIALPGVAASGFPLLLANPSLLNLVTAAEQTLGVTYQQIANEIVSGMSPGAQCLQSTLDSIASKLTNVGDTTSAAFGQIMQGISQDIIGQCNTITSSIGLGVNQCEQDIQTACQGLDKNQILQVPQLQLPNPDGWLYAIPYETWIAGLPPFYYLNSDCQLVWGVRLLENYDVDVPPGGNLYGPEQYDQILSAGGMPSLNGNSKEPTDNLVKANIASCKIPTLPELLAHVYPPVTQTVTVPNNPAPPQAPTVPITSVPSPPPLPSTGQAPNVCPPPTIVVNVSPTPVTINVPPCPPATTIQTISPAPVVSETLGATGVSIVPSEGLAAWEPPTNALVEQMLNALGFPRDFVELAGITTQIEELTFNNDEQEVAPDTEGMG